MRDTPIIFSAPMVRALLDGRKTQTRRILKPQPVPFAVDDAGTMCDVGLMHLEGDPLPRVWLGKDGTGVLTTQEVPYAVGDQMWVRENWQTGMTGDGPKIAYAATPDFAEIDAWDGPDEGVGPSFNYDKCPGAKWHSWLPDVLGNDGPWRPSIHMPRWASRLTLIVESVKVERLQDISEADAKAEGVTADEDPFWRPSPSDPDSGGSPSHRNSFEFLWGEIYTPWLWDQNPWVAAITFRVERPNIDALKVAA